MNLCCKAIDLEVVDAKNSRLEEVRLALKVNKSELARRIESPQSHISKVIKGEVPIGSYLSDKISRRLRLNPIWWDTGEGEMFLTDQSPEDEHEANTTPLYGEAIPIEVKYVGEVARDRQGNEFVDLPNGMIMLSVPLVDQHTYADYLLNWQNNVYLQDLPRHSVIIPKRHAGQYRAFEVRGDSMDNDRRDAICAGDIAVGRAIEQNLWKSKFHLHRFEDYVIVHQEGILTKRISDHNVEEGLITCVSTNPDKDAYPDFTIWLSEVYEIYNIVSVTQKRGRR